MSPRPSPAHRYKAETLPAKIGRQDQEPGHNFSVPNPAIQRAEKIRKSDAAIGTEDNLANLINDDWYQDQAQ